jgi:hypothetical protein
METGLIVVEGGERENFGWARMRGRTARKVGVEEGKAGSAGITMSTIQNQI